MYKIVDFSKVLMKDFINSLNKQNLICVDATLGNGNDSLYLSKLLDSNGNVYAYDIQELSITNSTKLNKNLSKAIVSLLSERGDLEER